MTGPLITDYHRIFRQIHRTQDYVAVFSELARTPRSKDKQATDIAMSAIKEAIRRHHVGRAVSAARTLLLLVGPNKALDRLKRDGALRVSSFEFNALVIKRIVDDWVQHAELYRLDAVAVDYLKSTSVLLSLAPSLRRLYLSIMARLGADRYVAIKSLFAEVDAAFTYPDNVDVGLGESRPVVREEMAEAFSYLLGLFHRGFKMQACQFGLTSMDAGYDARYRDLLGDAIRICRYREAEVLVERGAYRAAHGEEGIRVFSVDPFLERAIRVGYIQTETQAQVNGIRLDRGRDAGEVASLEAMADRFYELHGDHVAKLKLWPLPRYTIELPMVPDFAKLIRDERAFLEDLILCDFIAWEEYIETEEVPSALVSGSITVLDLLKAQRLFFFLHRGLVKAIESHSNFSEKAGLYMASCLAVFQQERLIKLLEVVVGAVKAPEILHLLTADPSASNLDIQYRPIIAAGGYCMLSLAVLSKSNLPRNLLCSEKRRLVPVTAGGGDRMQSSLVSALKQAGFLVVEEIELTVGRNRLEVDVIAWRDGHLFVFECKNNYHPCNAYELRATYDAMTGAANQLALRQAWLSVPANQREFFERMAWPATSPARIHTCIALGNRMFSGYNCEGHPVRHVHEMLNVLLRGYVEFEDGRQARFWEQETFGINDLIAFIEGSTTLADMTEALFPISLTTPIVDTALIQPTYALDLQKWRDGVLARYPLLDNEDHPSP